ncbi:MAG TPA: TetR/AcrR family transcriptional regulator [Trebonia sp.]|nr:TetR/AcrR family transcriptional regulator [Trebonia sp.]
MPRGQAIPDARAALFDAADRILSRQGPDGISSRAITDEAGVAKGVLHNHFHDLDDFLASYAVERIAAAFARTESLLARAGKRNVIDNLTDAATDLFGSGALAVSALMTARPALFTRVQQLLKDDGEGLDRFERSVAAYLDAEKASGRLPDDADSRMLAFHLIASIHHLFYITGQQPLRRREVRPIVASLLRP